MTKHIQKLNFNFIALMILLFGGPAYAQDIYPENGWWWNPDASGRGYMLERQGEVIFMTSFHYAQNGDPEWLGIVGTYVPSGVTSTEAGILNGEVFRSEDGQCIACVYREPVTARSTQDPATVIFHSNQSATLEWSGETMDLQRFFWGFANSLEQLGGQWLLVTLEADSDPVARIAIISVEDSSAVITDSDDGLMGFLSLSDGEITLSLVSPATELPVLVPETGRFYAGLRSVTGSAVLGVRMDDLPFVIPDDIAQIIDIKDAIFTRTSSDCADYANSYKADVLDQQRNRPFTESVVITATEDSCDLASNGIPNHDFNDSSAHFATPVSEIDSVFEISRNPELAAQATMLSQRMFDAVLLNGVVLDLLSAGCYRPGSAMADANGNVAIGCNVNDDWLLDPLGYTDHFGTDFHNAHTQPDGRYHYHGNPRALFSDSNSPGVSPVIGFAADGFPIHGSYFYDTASKTIRQAVSGYTLREGTRNSTTGPGGAYNGWYIDDYEFTNAGDLDACNGMTIDGHYGYYVTDSYPWVLGCLSGTPHVSFNKN